MVEEAYIAMVNSVPSEERGRKQYPYGFVGVGDLT